MFRTKQDVDRHAANVLGRIKNEREKNSRGYQIARLYFDVSEYEVAKRYLSSFLSVRETVPQAHKLMGHIFLKTNEKEKALECYKRALELDGTQKDLIIKICELCTQVAIDPDRARFWLEKAEQTCPGNDVIFRLREMIAQNSGDEDFQELEKLITTELTQRPDDVSLRVKLLHLYLKSGKLDHAYNVAVQTDRTMAFTDSLEWYETLLDVYCAYRGKNGCRGDLGFYTQFLHTVRNVVYLRLFYREPVACAEILHQFDQVLQEAVQIPKQQDDWLSFLTEMTGQFFFFCGTLLLKRAQKGVLSWKDVIPQASVCYLHNNSIVTIDSRSEWFVSASRDKLSMYDHLHMISNFRRSQGGHTLQALGKGDTATWTQKLRQQYCTQQGREKLYDTLFTQPDMRAKKDSSYLMKNQIYTESVLLFPTRPQMRSFDSGCYRLHPHSLTSFIWLALQRYSCKDKAQPYYGFDIFEKCVYSVKNMSIGGAESLCQLDTDVFLIASVRCAALRHQEMIHMGHTDPSQPDFLPLCLTKPLCSQEQADWWMAAYKFHTNTVKDNFSKMRHILQRGIEAVRLVAGHGMSINLIIHIARSLDVKAKEMKQLGSEFTLKAGDTENRAEFYWEQALEMLNRLEKNRNPPVPKHRLFKDDTDQDLDEATIKELMSEVQYAVGYSAMKKHKHEEAINIFDKLHTPYASFNSAKMYKVLAEQERSRDAPVGREQHQILLTKARDALFRTFDLLQGDKKHELNKSVQQLLDDVESQLQCVAEWDEDEEPSQYHTPTAIQLDGDVSSPDHSTPREKSRTKSPGAQVSFNTSDAARHIRPSPEHMDAKIRSLAYSQESLVKMVLARNEELVKINSQLVEALRENREVIGQLKSQLNLSQKYNYSSLSTPGPHMASPYHPPYPPPQGMAPPQFGYQMPSPAGLPGYRPPSPRSRSRTNLMGHTGFMGKDESNVVEGDEDDENPYFIDGEFFEESLAHPHGQYYMPDSHLEWPYGNRAGIEGSSTVTYAPQNRPQMPQSGFFASSLRGQSIQYGQSNIATSMPGPGYFSSPHGLTTASAMNQTPSLYAAIMGKDSPHNIGGIPAQIQSGAPSPAAQAIPQYLGQPAAPQPQPQPQPLPQPATTLASQMAQKPIFTSGNFGAGVKTASTPLTKGTSPQTVPAPPQPFSQMPQTQAQNLVNRAVTSTISPSASTAEVVCIFQGKATYTSKIGAKQEGNVKVFFFGAEKGGRVRMETLSTNQIILNHDINTLKLVASFTPQLVTWKRPQPDGKGEETVNLNFDNADLSQKLKSVIQKIQEAGKKSEASPPKPTAATSSPFTISGSQAFKPTTTQTPTGSSPAVFGQAQTGMPASAALAALSARQGEEKTVQSGETPKPSFGGFTFSTTPVIKTPEDKSKASPTVKLKESSLKVTSPGESGTVAASQPKPFAGFTFTPTKPTTHQAPVTVGTSSASAASSVFTLGQNIGSPMPSFSNLAANTSATGFSGFKTAHDSPSKGEDEDKVEEYEPNVDFKPVIDLPDLVEMKTGEEDEEKLFGERARLFRFDADTNQWKERGIGEVKILYNKAAKRYRILMRREQVLKICANHNITKDMKLTPMTSSDRAWCWSAMDFAEEEMKMEKLAIKFKTPELACQFKECFEKSQNMLEDSTVKPAPEAIGSSEVAEKKEDPKAQKSLADMFKPKTGSWECQACYCVNKGEQLRCPACNTIKPGAEEEVKKAETAKPAAGISSGGFKIGEGGFQIGGASGGGFSLGKKQEGGGFSFGSASSGGGFSFASKPAQKAEPSSKDTPKETGVDPGREAAKNILKSNASTIGPGGFSLGGGGFKLDGVGSDGFSFSPKPSTPAKPTKSEPADSTTGGLLAEMLQSNDPQPKTTAASSAATSGFSFTPKSSGFNFASAADSAKKDGGFQFNLGKVSTPVKNQDKDKKESSSPFQFTFSLTPSKTPQSKATVTSPKSPEGDYYVNKEGEDSHIYFEPIVSLPDKVDVKTGEEEEVTRFEQRAKLFRFSEGEWKERGLGTMKILEHKTSHRYRLLMRREQIFKVCCNHVITPELELKPMASGDGKSWVWYAKDFSEEEGKVEQLAIKFKNKEIADLFKKEFDAGKAGGEKGASAGAEGGVSVKHTEDTSDVQFLYIEEATEEQKAEARKYLLPESFYLYENKPPCRGCIGCEDYDPSKVNMSNKVKAKSKSEETSPAPTTASVKVSSSVSSVAGSVGASEGFSMFGQASGISFSSLAAQGDAVGFAFKKDENRPFQWSGAGQQIFGSSPAGNRTNDGDDDDEVVQSDDIDFKPIIELPELVEVKTGEEGWEVVYCQRSKLFRFVRESNQWKERAVGDMKILKQDDKYRMLMRRDQVHKVACNHLVAPNMVLSPMATSETAWCWTAQDYAENEAKIEQFALRFKTEELAKQFKKKFDEVQELVRQAEAAHPAKNANNSAAEPKTQGVSVTEEKDEDDDDDDDDSEEESIVFEKRATLTYFENDEWKKLGMGNLKILYNEDLNGNQIDMDTDDKLKICNHVICREHSVRLEKPKRACMWSAQDFSTDEPVRRNFKASFSSVAAAEEFAKSFMEGVSLARDSELSEQISHEMDTPVIFSHGDATGDQKR
ncbi:RANBP2-like and GRIP domain-containing protein 8 isoform X2 [Haliotis asinina]|uniref:RANBP2-like and GRIP domain-containing protein 8 isoform X2 n=1 Tax=Haliotis asinina TaxID=109174 RepID=UPI003531EC82